MGARPPSRLGPGGGRGSQRYGGIQQLLRELLLARNKQLALAAATLLLLGLCLLLQAGGPDGQPAGVVQQQWGGRRSAIEVVPAVAGQAAPEQTATEQAAAAAGLVATEQVGVQQKLSSQQAATEQVGVQQQLSSQQAATEQVGVQQQLSAEDVATEQVGVQQQLASQQAATEQADVQQQLSAEEVAAAAAAVGASAEVHGFVTKQGPADPRNWHPSFKSFRQTRLQTWLQRRQQALHAGQAPPPLPIYQGCQVFVNHLYKIIYLRHAKTASSSLFCHFGGCRDNATTGDEYSRLRFEPLQVTSVEQLQSLWRDYFVVTFVRNPYQRAISSYRMMMRQLAPGGQADTQYSWNRFCADPTGFAEECELDPVCSKRDPGFVYVHIQPQHQCILTEQGGWAVDYIGRVEHIDEDLAEVLRELEARRPPDAPPVKPLQGSLENVNGRGCNETAAGHTVAKEQYCDPVQYYTGQHAACFDEVRRHYYNDAHELQYGPAELGSDGTAVQ